MSDVRLFVSFCHPRGLMSVLTLLANTPFKVLEEVYLVISTGELAGSLKDQFTVTISAGTVQGNWLAGLPCISCPLQAVVILTLYFVYLNRW